MWCREKAARIGPHCAAVVERHLANPVLEKLRTVQGIVELANVSDRCIGATAGSA